jgi:hypothetical protein
MTNDDTSECSICGAMVKQGAKHEAWHEVLSALVPNLDAELEHRRPKRKKTGRATFL